MLRLVAAESLLNHQPEHVPSFLFAAARQGLLTLQEVHFSLGRLSIQKRHAEVLSLHPLLRHSPAPEVDDALLAACSSLGHWERALSVAAAGFPTTKGLTDFVLCITKSAPQRGVWETAIQLTGKIMDSRECDSGIAAAMAQLVAKQSANWKLAVRFLAPLATQGLSDPIVTHHTRVGDALSATLAAAPLSMIPTLVSGPLQRLVDPLRTVNEVLICHPEVGGNGDGRVALSLACQFAGSHLVSNAGFAIRDPGLWEDALRLLIPNMSAHLIHDADESTVTSSIRAAAVLIGPRRQLMKNLLKCEFSRRCGQSNWAHLVPVLLECGLEDEAVALAGADTVAVHVAAKNPLDCPRALALAQSRAAAAQVLLLSGGSLWKEALTYCGDDLSDLRKIGLMVCCAGAAWGKAMEILCMLSDLSAAEEKTREGVYYHIGRNEASILVSQGKWREATEAYFRHRYLDHVVENCQVEVALCHAALSAGAWLEAVQMLNMSRYPSAPVHAAVRSLQEVMEAPAGDNSWQACLERACARYGASSDRTLLIANATALALHLRRKHDDGEESDAAAAFSVLARLVEQSAVKLPSLRAASRLIIRDHLPHRSEATSLVAPILTEKWVEEVCPRPGDASALADDLDRQKLDEAATRCRLAAMVRWKSSAEPMLGWEAALRYMEHLEVGDVMTALSAAGRLTDAVDVLALAAKRNRIRSNDHLPFAAVLRAVSHPDVTPLQCRLAAQRLLMHSGEQSTNNVVRSITNLLDGTQLAAEDACVPPTPATFFWTKPRVLALAMHFPQLAKHFRTDDAAQDTNTSDASKEVACRKAALEAFGSADMAPIVASVMSDLQGQYMLVHAAERYQTLSQPSHRTREVTALCESDLRWFAQHGIEIAYAPSNHARYLQRPHFKPPHDVRHLRRILYRNLTAIRHVVGDAKFCESQVPIPDVVARTPLLAALSMFVRDEKTEPEWIDVAQDVFFSLVNVGQIKMFWRKHEQEIKRLAGMRWSRAAEEELARRCGEERTIPTKLEADPSKSTSQIVDYWQTFGLLIQPPRGRLPAAVHRQFATAALVAWSNVQRSSDEDVEAAVASSVRRDESLCRSVAVDDLLRNLRQHGMKTLRESAHCEAMFPLSRVHNYPSTNSDDVELVFQRERNIDAVVCCNREGVADRWKLGVRVLQYAHKLITPTASRELLEPFADCVTGGRRVDSGSYPVTPSSAE